MTHLRACGCAFETSHQYGCPTGGGRINARHVVCAKFECGCLVILCPSSSLPEYIAAAGCKIEHRPVGDGR